MATFSTRARPLPILVAGDPRLTQRSAEIAGVDAAMLAQASDLVATLRDFRQRSGFGRAISAVQCGIPRRLVAMDLGAEPFVLINPEIEWLSNEVVVAEEGCLSLPRVSMDVERPLHARLNGLDVDGESIRIEASGLEARVLQHELDHLDGVLILDRAPRAQRKGALRALREGGSYSPPLAEQDEADEGEHREPKSTP